MNVIKKIDVQKINMIIIYLIIFIFYSFFIRPADWNINSRLALVKAIVEENRFEIDTYQASEFYSGDVAARNGHFYSDKAIGTSLIGSLVFFPIHLLHTEPLSRDLFIMLITTLAIGMPSALLGPLIFQFSFRETNNLWLSFIISMAICLGTPIYPYAGAYYSHSLVAMMVMLIYIFWFGINRGWREISPRWLAASGFVMGFIILTEYPALLICFILFLYMVFVIIKKQGKSKLTGHLITFFIGGAIPLIIFLYYNWICFGSPFSTGYSNEYLHDFSELRNVGFMGIGWPSIKSLIYMTIHPMIGVFVQSPVLLLSFIGLIAMTKRKDLSPEILTATSAIIIFFLFNSGSINWWGGDSFTARYVIPALPFFGIFMPYIHPKYIYLLIFATLMSIFHMLVASATFYHYFDQYITETLKKGWLSTWDTNLLYRELIPKLLHHRLTYSWGHLIFGLDSWYFNFSIPLFTAAILTSCLFIINKNTKYKRA